jgi:hypothetical protein
MSWRTTSLVATAFVLGAIAAGVGSVQAAWEPIGRFIGLGQPPLPASANVLSEHEIEALEAMPPQSQAELLLERSINHYRGANDQIAARVARWRGRVTMDNRLRELFDAAIAPLLDVFHDDASATIRERAACGLAQSGMFTASQRWTAVPTLLNFAQDGALQGDTREWVFQALRDITGQNLPHDALRWRDWYATSGRK